MRNRLKKIVRRLPSQKKKIAVKKARIPRDVFSFDELLIILACIDPPRVSAQSVFSYHKKRAALLILYITGLRISNLLCISVGQANKLLAGGCPVGAWATINLIKKRKLYPHRIRFSSGDLAFVKKFDKEKSIEFLLAKKNYDDLVFAPRTRSKVAFERSTFDKQLNLVCRKASEKLGKHIRTHSFRATYITNALVNNRVEQVQKQVGHSNINNTLIYDHRFFSSTQQCEYEKKLDLVKYIMSTHPIETEPYLAPIETEPCHAVPLAP